MTAAMAYGLGDFALNKGADYARQRAPFGQPIGSYQAIQHPMARAKVMLEAARVRTQVVAGKPIAQSDSRYKPAAAGAILSRGRLSVYVMAARVLPYPPED